MNKYLFLVSIIGLFSCNPNVKSNVVQSSFTVKNVESDDSFSNKRVEIVTIEDCQYVWVQEGYSGGITHKGNCSNPICRTKNEK